MADFQYGTRSREKLSTCYEPLLRVAYRALELSPTDVTIAGYLLDVFRNLLQQQCVYCLLRTDLPDVEVGFRLRS